MKNENFVAVAMALQPDTQVGRQPHIDRQAGRQTGIQTDRQTGRQAGRQTDRQTDRQRDRPTGRQANHSHCSLRVICIDPP